LGVNQRQIFLVNNIIYHIGFAADSRPDQSKYAQCKLLVLTTLKH